MSPRCYGFHNDEETFSFFYVSKFSLGVTYFVISNPTRTPS